MNATRSWAQTGDDYSPPRSSKPENDSVFYLPLSRSSLDAGALAITLTADAHTRGEALALINRRYAWRGYGSDHSLPTSCNETTFTVHFDGSLLCTASLAADCSQGLAVDRTFPEEMQFFRRMPNAKLCEIKKLAMENGAPSKPVLASLFHFLFLYGINNLLGTDLLIEVNPRHAPFYQKMLRFKRVGGVRNNASVNAPSQLMWLSVKEIDRSIAESQTIAQQNTLYKYFYSSEFADRVVNELNLRGLKDGIGR